VPVPGGRISLEGRARGGREKGDGVECDLDLSVDTVRAPFFSGNPQRASGASVTWHSIWLRRPCSYLPEGKRSRILPTTSAAQSKYGLI